MSKLKVQKVHDTDDRSLPVFAEIDEWMEQVRKRAFDLFVGRGFRGGHALDDWLTAERQLCWPVAELEEGDDFLILTVALAGFKPDEINITANPREVIVKASHEAEGKGSGKSGKIHWSEFRSNDVCRRIELPAQVDVDEVSAKLEDGLLKIRARKLAEQKEREKQIKISTAA